MNPPPHDLGHPLVGVEVDVKLPPEVSAVDADGKDDTLHIPKGGVEAVVRGAEIKAKRFAEFVGGLAAKVDGIEDSLARVDGCLGGGDPVATFLLGLNAPHDLQVTGQRSAAF